jgi:hypothetical protein
MFTVRLYGPKGGMLEVTKLMHNFHTNVLKNSIKKQAYWAAGKFKEHIISSKKRGSLGSSDLANAINVEVVGDGYGVGNITTLNMVAPYWQVLNSGKTRQGRKFVPGNGMIVPKGSFQEGYGGSQPVVWGSGGLWTIGGAEGKFAFRAKKFMEGNRYIDLTLQDARFKFNSTIKAELALFYRKLGAHHSRTVRLA